jgi:large subunit ribosomal protein L5
MNRLKEKYQKEVVEKLSKDLKLSNKMATPKLKKVVVNMGVGGALKSKEVMAQLKKDLMSITGQMPSDREARVSVASFSIRRGMIVGLKVTLRGVRMYSFLDKLFSIVLPRLRDFRGVSSKSFDKTGNYTLGVEEHSVFPEIDITKSQQHGLEITIVTNTKNKDESYKLLSYLGMPFEKNGAISK